MDKVYNSRRSPLLLIFSYVLIDDFEMVSFFLAMNDMHVGSWAYTRQKIKKATNNDRSEMTARGWGKRIGMICAASVDVKCTDQSRNT